MQLVGVPAFSNPQLERRFSQQQNQRRASDRITYLAFSCLWFCASLWFAYTQSVQRLRICLAGTLTCLMPLLLPRQSYSAYRRAWVAGFRAAFLLLPTLATQLLLAANPQDLPSEPGLGGLFTLLLLGASLELAWGLAIGLQLDLGAHLLVQLLLAVRVVLFQSRAVCEAPYANEPATRQLFSLVGSRLTSYSDALLFWMPFVQVDHDAAPSSSSSRSSALPHCQALIIATHLILGLLLPTISMYVLERGRRAKFLLEVSSQIAAQAGVEIMESWALLGMPRLECLQVCTFDGLGVWLQLFSLLPLLVAGAWLAALMMCPGPP